MTWLEKQFQDFIAWLLFGFEKFNFGDLNKFHSRLEKNSSEISDESRVH